ncbi:hypothetical protein CLIM01_09364 [Colletotrichum limetticola]|uniref:Fungal N-terminal domain-containing protein n=1 Tax=Colletotrichum limetticola TaxID=1209924 RepID=A0ABQ9PP70_9PEZI|nr:hypothetical protein CLIM01_09364 [Colletotrichum limetticola]
MSGLEGIAGLSLACNVMQLISFGHEAISMCRRVYESGSPEPDLSEYAESLKAVCDGLEKSLGKRPTPVPAAAAAFTRAPAMEKRLLDLAAKCVKNARDLEEEIKFLSPSQPGKLGALVAAPKILWRKRRLERLKGNLDDAQKVMDTSILERLFARVEALYQANNKGLSDLSQELQQFITDHAASNSILRNAIETQTKGIQDHVTMESSKTQNEIKSHVSLKLSSHEIAIKNHVLSTAQDVQNTFSQRMTSREDSKAKEQAYQQLLKSLKYPGMNERRNQVSESHPRTFRWIFSDSMYLSDSESEYSTEGNSSAYSDEPVNVETSSIRSDEPSELSEGSDGASYSVPRPWDSFVDWLKDDTQKTYWISGKPVADTSDDGVDRLLDLIDELVSTNQVKVCVSSRPEPALKRFLERSPMLKIQDLTSRDIHLLTRERLEAIGIDLENDESDDLSELICEKAEGVFIWVILVLNSLKRGLDNYDDMDTLYSRVVSLPRDLTKLYKEMWSRMKEDSDLYRRKTVLLFYMAMEFKTQSNRVHIWKPNANLLGLAISTDDEMLKSFMAGQELPDMELLWQKWHRLGRKLPAICAGLLDITDPEEAFSSLNDYETRRARNFLALMFRSKTTSFYGR